MAKVRRESRGRLHRRRIDWAQVFFSALAGFIPSFIMTFFMMLIKSPHGEPVTFYVVYPTGYSFLVAWAALSILIWRFTRVLE